MMQRQTSAGSDAIGVGMTASLTGTYRQLGAQALAGARLWAQEANRRGGILVPVRGGRVPISFLYYDDESDPRVAARYTRRLLQDDGVDLLLGPYSSGLTLAATRVAEECGTVLWNHGGAADTLYEQGFRWIVGVLSPAGRYFQGIVELVRRMDPSARRLALFGAGRSGFARAVLAGAETQARVLEFEIVFRGDHRAPDGGRQELLRSLRASRPDLILAAGAFEDDILLARHLVECHLRARAIGLVAAGVDAFYGRLGDAADGFLGPSQWEPALPRQPDVGPPPREAAAALAAAVGQPADYPAAQACAAGFVVERCVEVAGTPAPRRLRDVAGQLDFTTFYGRFRIDPLTGRQVGHEPAVVQWQGGRKRVVWPAAVAEVAPTYPRNAPSR